MRHYALELKCGHIALGVAADKCSTECNGITRYKDFDPAKHWIGMHLYQDCCDGEHLVVKRGGE